jgi:hypothetical protein
MYSAGRPQIDEQTRRQLLDNYLRNQQTQSSIGPQSSQPAAATMNNFNISSMGGGQFHPAQFQTPSVVHSAYMDDRSETFSDISRRSVMTTPNVVQSQQSQHNFVQVNEQRQQQPSVQTQNTEGNDNLSIVPITELPENISIEDFSNLVKKWIELDNWIKKSQEIAKQKRKQKDKLSEVITHYMTRYNIEDLNTSEGKIRCKVRYVKSGVNQKVVKEKIAELLKDNEETCNTLITKIFNEREKVEKMSLRRIKIT